MEFNQIETRIEEIKTDDVRCCENELDLMSISLEAEVPEALYVGMKDFISGNEKENSVLDNWNRLWECQNVLVVDGACWPTSSWQSPTLTMMAITKRACEKAIIDFKG